MCGIVGTVGFGVRVAPDLLERQRDTMVHRGPDSCGLWISEDQSVGFGHRRLAIIDLSPGGHQPMVHRPTGNVITFNGEIYNYLELRKTLQSLGHHFESQSDTEVVLAAFAQWGKDCLQQLEGMFAFAIYDRSTSRVLLARDRAGEKPLFYTRMSSGLSFASEAKALLMDPSVRRHVKLDSLNEFLAYGYVIGENTMFSDILRVKPGHWMEIDPLSASIQSAQYWSIPEFDGARLAMSDEAVEQETEALLRSAVRRQLVADVPVGVLLSGGVDSSLVTAIAASVSSNRLRTFTARFPGHGGFDEGPYARMVAKHLGTEHIELEAPPATADLLMSLVTQFDDPIADSSMIPTYLVSREIRRHATVAIGGDGGDELFGGYFRYPSYLRQERIRRSTPKALRKLASLAGRSLIPPGARGRGLLDAIAGDLGTSLENAGRLYRADERTGLSHALGRLQPQALAKPESIRSSLHRSRATATQRGTALDFSTYMVDDVLVKVDRASMLTSLEVRAPFLDVRLIDHAFRGVPDRLKVTEQERKIVLRRIGARLLPKNLDLTRKQGFSIPVDGWMRGPWKGLLAEACECREQSIVDTDAIRRYRKLLEQGHPVGERLFALITLRLWERCYGLTDLT